MTAQPQPTAALSDAELIEQLAQTSHSMNSFVPWERENEKVKDDYRVEARWRVQVIDAAGYRLARADSGQGVSRERLAQIIQPFTPSYVMASKCADAVLAALADAGTEAE